MFVFQFADCVPIGRDLVRLLQNVARFVLCSMYYFA